MKAKQLISLLILIPLLISILAGCSLQSQSEETNESVNYESVTNGVDTVANGTFIHNIMTPDLPVIFESTMYYADNTGVWMKESGKEEKQLSGFSANSVATDGNVVYYSYNDIDNSTGNIRRVRVDGKEDVEICETSSVPEVIAETDGKVWYTAFNNTDSPTIGLYSYDTVSGEEVLAVEDVFRCSVPVNNKVVYLDSGGSEFSTVGKLHLFNLSDGIDKVIDDNDYEKAIYQINDIVYTVSKKFGEESECNLYAYDMNTHELKQIYTMLKGRPDEGVNILGTFGNLLIYAVEDYSVINGSYTYFKFDTINNEVTEITGLSSERASLFVSDTDALFVFYEYACRFDTLERVMDFGDNPPLFTAYFDGNLYCQNEDAHHIVYYPKQHETISPDEALEDYLGSEMAVLTEKFGESYSYVELPETGLIDCITFDAMSNIAFGFSNNADEVVLISVKDCNESIRLTHELTSNMTGSEVLSLRESYSVSENYSEMLQSYIVTVKRDDGLILIFEWDDSNYHNKIANYVTMQRI